MRAEGEIGPSRAANNKNLHQHLSIDSALLWTIPNGFIASSEYVEGLKLQHAFYEISCIGSKTLE